MKPTPKPVAPKPAAPKPAARSLTVAQENAKGTARTTWTVWLQQEGLIDKLKFEGYKTKDMDAVRWPR